MDAQIRVSDGDELKEIADLWEWLRGERVLAGTLRAIPRPPGEGEMGGAFDMLAVALGSGGTGAVLARSLTAWLQSRRANVTVTLMTKAGTVEVDAHHLSPDDVIPLLQQVMRDDDV